MVLPTKTRCPCRRRSCARSRTSCGRARGSARCPPWRTRRPRAWPAESLARAPSRRPTLTNSWTESSSSLTAPGAGPSVVPGKGGGWGCARVHAARRAGPLASRRAGSCEMGSWKMGWSSSFSAVGSQVVNDECGTLRARGAAGASAGNAAERAGSEAASRGSAPSRGRPSRRRPSRDVVRGGRAPRGSVVAAGAAASCLGPSRLASGRGGLASSTTGGGFFARLASAASVAGSSTRARRGDRAPARRRSSRASGVGEEPPRERRSSGCDRALRERVDEHRDEVGLRARLELARGRELALDRPNLVGEAKDVEVADVLRPDERDRRPGPPRAPRSPGAVDVRFGGLREVRVDDVGEVRDVDPARGHVGRDEEAQLPLARRAASRARGRAARGRR